MEDRKLRRNNNINVKEKTKLNKTKLASRILMTVLTAIVIFIFAAVIYLKVLPNKFLIPLCVLGLGLDGFGLFTVYKRKTTNKSHLILSIVSGLLIIVLGFVSSKLIKMMNFLGTMSTETVNSKTYSVVVLKDSKYEKIEDIAYKILLCYDNELGQNKEAIDKINSVLTLVSQTTDDVHELADKLLAKEVDAILMEDSYYAIIEEENETFRDQVREIYSFTLEDTIETIAKEVSVTQEPFNIYVSGIDTYGKISSVARSDVNMLVSVNPKTKQILLVNVPRDYYVQLHGTTGYRDKLTHAGIYGIDMSVKTIEDLFKTDINYYCRVNFTSLINIINAIGGLEVYSDYDFTSRIGKYHFKVGYNKMNGKQALGFARERYSFSAGDRQRGKNQQAVIEAMVKKVCSSSTILTKFDSLLDSLKGSFQTNMSTERMLELVRMQISDNAEWKITSISVDGLGSTERTYSMGKTLLYVMIPYSGSVNKASSMIKQILSGEILQGGSVDLSKYNDVPVVARGVYPKDSKVEKKKEDTKKETTKTSETKQEVKKEEEIKPVNPYSE